MWDPYGSLWDPEAKFHMYSTWAFSVRFNFDAIELLFQRHIRFLDSNENHRMPF